MKKSTFLGVLAFGCTIGFLYIRKKEGESSSINGIEIKINPQKLVDGALAMSDMNPIAKNGIRNIAHKAIQKYYEN